MKAAILIIGIGLMIFCGVMAVNATIRQNDTTGIAKDAFQLINEKRSESGIPALIWDNELEEKAINYSKHMSDEGSLVHSTMGYTENILTNSGGFPSGSSVYQPWANSYGHYVNMMDRNVRYAAIGIFKDYATFLGR